LLLLTYSNGGHNAALLFGPNDVCRELAHKHGPALGARPGLMYNEEVDTLEPRHILFLYTDGVTEALSPQDELYGADRFTKLVCSCQSLKLSQMFNYIDKDLKDL
jgi:sigma-B regulation protein RsbU (phosphoserine phosphatase)